MYFTPMIMTKCSVLNSINIHQIVISFQTLMNVLPHLVLMVVSVWMESMATYVYVLQDGLESTVELVSNKYK